MKTVKAIAVASALAVVGLASAAQAVTYNYVDWTAANPGGGTATGVITLPDTSTVTVDFAVVNPDGSAGSFFFAQTSGAGTNYWNPTTPYVSTQVDNAPGSTDILALIGGTNQTYQVTLSEAIKDPIMAIVSLGRGGSNTTYDFDSPFDIVSQGTGYWGGNGSALQELPGDILQGNEGHGTIQFIGTFSTFSWVAPSPENWHGFTFGIRTTERLEPTDPVDVPVPAMLPLLGLGLAAIGLGRRRKS